MNYFNMDKIEYKGVNTDEVFAFKHYNQDEVIMGKTMAEHLKFAMSYWHTLVSEATDPFGYGTRNLAWNKDGNNIEIAKHRVDAGFELMEILGIEYFCFHDEDVLPEFGTFAEYVAALNEVVDYIEAKMNETNIKLLWATTNAFAHERFVHGASTSCNATVFAYAAAKVKNAMDIANRLGARGYVFWGGREGYDTLLNTNMGLEKDNLARLLQMAVDYKKAIGFDGTLLIEPKPKEPTKHQYDFDAETVLGFLRKYGLENEYQMNIEVNHATLAGHTIHHEMVVSRENNVLGSVDANYGDLLLGWDTDQFPTNVVDASLMMYEILKNGGLPVGINFDAKVRRGSFQIDDVVLAYIVGMDTFAKGLKVAAKLLEDRVFEDFIDNRYRSYNEGIGLEIVEGKHSLESLFTFISAENPQVINESGRQEYLEFMVNHYIEKGDK